MIAHLKEPNQWLQDMGKRRLQNVVTVALANKRARTIWAMLGPGGISRRGISPASGALFAMLALEHVQRQQAGRLQGRRQEPTRRRSAVDQPDHSHVRAECSGNVDVYIFDNILIVKLQPPPFCCPARRHPCMPGRRPRWPSASKLPM